MKRQARFRELVRHDRLIARVLDEGGVAERERNNPAWVAQYLACCAEHDPALRRSAAYQAAQEHAHAAQQEAEVVGKIGKAYEAALSAGLVSREEADRLLRDPGALKAKINDLQRRPDVYWGETGQLIADAYYSAEAYEADAAADADADLPEPEPEPAPDTDAAPPPLGQTVQQQPAPAPDISRQIKQGMELMRTDPKQYWSEAHQAKMTGLFEQQLAAEQGETSAPTTTTPIPNIGDTDNE
jgi:hypothetical protein